MQLKRVVEMAGMLSHCDFVEQSQFEADGQILRPDLIVNLPGGKHVVVDAKAPLQAFLDAHEAKNEEQRQTHLRLHARQLRVHTKKLSSKGYWAQFDSAPDFVFLFLPGEHFYNAALEADPQLIEEGVNQCVIVAMPTTLITLLRAVAYGWQQEKVAEDARAIAEVGRELHERLSVYVEHMQKLGRRLNSAVSAFNDAVGSMESRVLPGARRFLEHGAVSAGRALPALEPVESSVRAIRAPQLVERTNDTNAAGAASATEE
jgi:DNA recombination protein RmuC